jgi:hypothetical protein
MAVIAAAISAAINAGEEPEWKVEFQKVYGLKEKEVLKRVSEPFPACRKSYCDSLKEIFPAFNADSMVMNYRWNGKDVEFWSLTGKQPQQPAASPLISILNYLGVPYQEIEIQDNLRFKPIEGEFVMRTGTPTEKLVQRLQLTLQNELKLRIAFTYKTEEREVVVASGKYESKPLADREKNQIDLYAKNRRDPPDAGGGSGSFDEFLQSLGSYVSQRVVNELSETPRGKFQWLCHNSITVLPGPDPERDPEGVLKKVSSQTGVTFEGAKRKVRVLLVESK